MGDFVTVPRGSLTIDHLNCELDRKQRVRVGALPPTRSVPVVRQAGVHRESRNCGKGIGNKATAMAHQVLAQGRIVALS